MAINIQTVNLKIDVSEDMDLGIELNNLILSSTVNQAFLYDENEEKDYEIEDIIFSGGYFIFKCEGNVNFFSSASNLSSPDLYNILSALQVKNNKGNYVF